MAGFWPSRVSLEEVARRDAMIAAGRCPGPCGGNAPYRGTVFCKECLRTLTPWRWGKALYDARKAAGLCPHCLRPRGRQDGVLCSACKAAQRSRQREEYRRLKEEGRCVRHRRRRAVQGTIFCGECLQAGWRRRRARAASRSEG